MRALCAWMTILVVMPAPARRGYGAPPEEPVAPTTRPADGDRDAARVLLRKGAECVDRGEHAEALELFRRGQSLYPSHRFDLNIAVTLRRMGRPAEAAEAFDRFVARAAGIAPRDKLELARRNLGDIAARLAAIRLRCPVAGAKVTLDGRVVGRTPMGHRIFAEPGRRAVVLSKVGHGSVTRRLTLRAGDHVELELTPRVAAPASAPVAAKATTRSRPPRERSPWIGWSLVAAGGSLAATGAAVGLGIKSNATYGDFEDAAGRGDAAAAGSLKDRGQKEEAATIGCAVAAGVLAVVSATLLYLWHRDGRASARR